MGSLDEILEGLDRGEAKDARFEVSTVKEFLKALGMKKEAVDGMSAASLCWDEFNAANHLDVYMGSGKDFAFSFEEFFTKPRRHPIVEAVGDWHAAHHVEGPWVFVFNVYGHGRMCATNLVIKDVTHIRVVTEVTSFNVTHFKHIMSRFAGTLSSIE